MIQRFFEKNSFHHVYNRGNQRRETFRKEQDYRVFLLLTAKYSKKYAVNIITYCLISNHYHLVLQQSDKYSLTRFMHALGIAYARYFNWEYKTVGHVFQGPYRATHIESEESLVNEINYVLNNPVKHGIVEDPTLYPWVGMWNNVRANLL